MKKIILLTILVFSLQRMSAAYTVSQEKGVKISRTDIDRNNSQIEEAVRKEMTEKIIMAKEERDKIKKEAVDPISEGELFIDIVTTEDAMFSYHYTQNLLIDIYNKMSTGYEIIKINYMSPLKAEVTVNLKGPDIGMLDEQNINRKAEERFKAKMGYTVQDATNKKWKAKEELTAITELYKITVKVLSEELAALKETDKATRIIKMDKVNNIWKIQN